MPHVIEKTVFSFDELEDRAKERARDWFRQGALDHNWWEFIYEDAATIGEILGIHLRMRSAKLAGGGTRMEPAIFFSGFSSQGDGACFEGSWYWRACGKAIRDHAPKDERLYSIADALTAIVDGEAYSASIKHRGHYSHSGCMDIDVCGDDDWYRESKGNADDIPQDVFSAVEEVIIQAMRDFADWIYRQLEKEYEWQMADEQIDESIRANEYEFDEYGKIA